MRVTDSLYALFQVLEVHEQLEKPKEEMTDEELDDEEKAIVREMCNVRSFIFLY